MWLGSSLPFNGHNLNFIFLFFYAEVMKRLSTKSWEVPSSAYRLTLCSFSTALNHKICCISKALQNVFHMSKWIFHFIAFSSLKLFAYVFCSFLSPGLSVPTVSGLGEVGSFGPFSDSATCKKSSVCSLSCHHKMEAKLRFMGAKWRVS